MQISSDTFPCKKKPTNPNKCRKKHIIRFIFWQKKSLQVQKQYHQIHFFKKKNTEKNQNKNNPTNEEKTYTQINFLQVNKKPYKSKNNINLFGKKKKQPQ